MQLVTTTVVICTILLAGCMTTPTSCTNRSDCPTGTGIGDQLETESVPPAITSQGCTHAEVSFVIPATRIIVEPPRGYEHVDDTQGLVQVQIGLATCTTLSAGDRTYRDVGSFWLAAPVRPAGTDDISTLHRYHWSIDEQQASRALARDGWSVTTNQGVQSDAIQAPAGQRLEYDVQIPGTRLAFAINAPNAQPRSEGHTEPHILPNGHIADMTRSGQRSSFDSAAWQMQASGPIPGIADGPEPLTPQPGLVRLAAALVLEAHPPHDHGDDDP